MISFGKVPSIVKELGIATVVSWYGHGVPTMGAALAYYTVFSLAPAGIIIIAVLNFVFGDGSSPYVYEMLESFLGPTAAQFVQLTMRQADVSGAGLFATVTGGLAVCIGASGAFVQLQSSLNTIWDAPPSTRSGLLSVLIQRGRSFLLVLLIGALLVCSVALTTALSAFGSVVTDNLPGMSVLISWAEFGLSFAIVTALFALVFRVLPDVTLPARAIWVGAATTSLLFSLGKIALSAYLAHGSVASPYGAAGALVVLLVWVYYSSQIFLLGAEFTRRYAFYSQNR